MMGSLMFKPAIAVTNSFPKRLSILKKMKLDTKIPVPERRLLKGEKHGPNTVSRDTLSAS